MLTVPCYPLTSRPTPILLQRKRQIEAQVYALEEELREQGYTDEEVARKSRALRDRLERDSKALTAPGGGAKKRCGCDAVFALSAALVRVSWT